MITTGTNFSTWLRSRYVEWNSGIDFWCGEKMPGYRAYYHPDHFQPMTPTVFHNLGDGRFKDVCARSHLAKYPGEGLSIATDMTHIVEAV